MDFLQTKDFKNELYKILKEYEGTNLNLMISGGSLLNVLINEKIAELDTTKWNIYYADERMDKDNLNYTASLPFLKLLKGNVNKIDVSLSPEIAAKDYEKNLPTIDLCFLGIGGDGHICSLMPESEDLNSSEYVINTKQDFSISPERITVTLKFLNEKVKKLYFIVPNSDEKNIDSPAESIKSKLNTDCIVMLKEVTKI